jgi:hypothetical protein
VTHVFVETWYITKIKLNKTVVYMNTKPLRWTIACLALLILISCTLEEPVIPTWVTEWGIPFDESFTMAEALNDSNFVIDTTSTGEARIAISISDTSEEKTVTTSDLAIKPESDAASDTIDDLNLGTQGPEESTPFDLADVMGGPVTPGTVNIPPGTVGVIDLILLLYDDIRYAHVETGTFQIQLVNNTPLDIDAGTHITIYDDSTGIEIGTTDIPVMIPANSSAFATPDMILDDKEIHTCFELQMQVPLVPGSYIVTQQQIDNSTSWVNGTLFDMEIYEAEARFPEQTLFIDDSSSIMEEEHRVRKGIVDQGRIFLNLENNIDATARVNVRLLNFYHILTGETLTDSVVLPPTSITPKTIFVEDYRFVNYPDSNLAEGEYVDYIHYDVDIITDSTESFVTISQDDSVYVEVEPDSLYFQMIDGEINDIEIDIEPIVKDDLGDLSKVEGEIYLDSLKMTLNLYNETNIPIDITLHISGSNDTEEITLDPIVREIPRVDAGGSLQIELTGDDPSYNIVELMGILPTSIRMEAEAFIDDVGSVRVGQSVWADYKIYSPLWLRIADTSSITSDIQEQEITDQENLENNVSNPMLFVDLNNALPISAVSSIYVSNDSTELYDETEDDSTKFIIKDLYVDPGLIGSDGYVESAEKTEIIIELTPEQFAVFYNNDRVYIGTKTKLDPTDDLVKFRPDDGMDIFGFFRFRYKIDVDKE